MVKVTALLLLSALGTTGVFGEDEGRRPARCLLFRRRQETSRILWPLSHDSAAAKGAILSTTARGGTALYNGLYTTLKEMTRLDSGDSDMRRRALVVLSDGDDTSSLVSFNDVMELDRQSGRDGAYRHVQVRIVDRAGAQPRTSAGYFAPHG